VALSADVWQEKEFVLLLAISVENANNSFHSGVIDVCCGERSDMALNG